MIHGESCQEKNSSAKPGDSKNTRLSRKFSSPACGQWTRRLTAHWISKNGNQLRLRLIHRGLSSFQIRVELLLPDRTPLSGAETEALLVTAVTLSFFSPVERIP